MFDALGIPLFEMRCPCCTEVQKVQASRFKDMNEPVLTKCCSCKEFLVLYPEIQFKPNNTLFTLEVIKVPSPKKKPTIEPSHSNLSLVSSDVSVVAS